MPNRGFRTYLLGGFAAISIVMVLLGIYAVVSFYQIQDKVTLEQKKVDALLLKISQIDASYVQQNLAWSNILIYGKDPAKYHDYLSSFYKSERQTLKLTEELHDQLQDVPKLRSESGDFLVTLYDLRKSYRTALKIYNSSVDSPYSTQEFLSVVTSRPSAALENIDAGIRQYHNSTLAELEQSSRSNEIRLVLLTIIALGILLVLLLWFIDKIFARPMSHLIGAARQVAQGDLSHRVEIFGKGEFGEFARTFNQMLENLQKSNTELESIVQKLQDEVEERKRIEKRLEEESRSLAASNKELESFSYSVSHDLRAPLRSISGFSQILKEDYSDQVDDAGKGYLSRIQTAANRMGEIIDDLLQLSRVNRKPLVTSSVDLSRLAEEILSELRERDPDRKIEIHVEPGMTTYADPNLARIVMVNLLGNAWKYSRDKIEARIDVERAREEGRTLFRVRDNGAGFDMEFAGNLFQPFQRLHNEDEFEGTGIGLAIVDRILHRHGGSIRADAEPGKGATFTFQFDGN